MFLKPLEIKVFFLFLLAKYKTKYSVKIYDFNIMDNHFHVLARAESAEQLGDFMRTVNSQLARRINKYFDRDSQALRERYKSPCITNPNYLVKVMQYVWLNRFKVDRSRPDLDLTCSASWRLNADVISKLSNDPDVIAMLERLLDSYDDLPISISDAKRFIRKMLNTAISNVNAVMSAFSRNSHTIGDTIDVEFRGELLSAFRREPVPRVYC